MPGLFQVTVYFDNGSVFRAVPMEKDKATDFSLSFITRPDVLKTISAPVERTDAQKSLRWAAAEWKKLIERTRANPEPDVSGTYQFALNFYQAFQKLGASS